VQQLQGPAAPQSRRLLRVLLVWLGEVPRGATAAWLLRTLEFLEASACTPQIPTLPATFPDKAQGSPRGRDDRNTHRATAVRTCARACNLTGHGRSYKAQMVACSCTRSRLTRILGGLLFSSAWARVSSLSIVSITSIISIRWITTTSVCDLERTFTADHSPAVVCTYSAACTGLARCMGPLECDGTSPTFSIRTSHLRWPKGAPQERIA
jgi:hypothetical protein